MYKVLKSSKAAIRFSLKHSKKYLLENRCQVSLIILWFSFGGPDKRVSYSTGYTVSYADWDYQKQRVKTNKSRVINSHTVNNYLNKLETELMNTYSRSIDEERLITKELVRETLDIVTGKIEPDIVLYAQQLRQLRIFREQLRLLLQILFRSNQRI
jgi:hypothetical protein